ncbi:MAG: site-2 protease family protein [Spirochaetales bacterium]|nr:site-2 protease family protein [Spirochaetales bacterium]
MNLNSIDFEYVLIGIICFIIAGSVHEFAHAFSAYILGDDTARINGRMTLNPLAHIDMWGSLFFPFFGAISGLPVIGWMKPVPVNPNNFKNPSRDDAICALAGPFSNLLQASFILIVLKLIRMVIIGFSLSTNILVGYIYFALKVYFSINICLMIFNLLPIPPLDGGWILRHFLPDDWKDKFDQIRRYGFIILYVLVITNIFDYIFIPLVNGAESFFTALLTANILVVCLPFAIVSGITLYFLREEVGLFVHRIKHLSTLKILKGEKKDLSFTPAEPALQSTEYTVYSDEYEKKRIAGTAWKTCDRKLFDKLNNVCIKCDKYISCLSEQLKKPSSPS